MDFELNETERMLQNSLIRFRDEIAGLDEATQWAQCAEMGLQGASVPEELGGFGLGLVGPMLIAEQLAAGRSVLSWHSDAALPAVALSALAKAGNDQPLADFLSGTRYRMKTDGDEPGICRIRVIRHQDTASIELTRNSKVAVTPLPTEVLTDLQMVAEITLAADHLGAIQQLFDMTLEYTQTRQQFGQPLSAFQALKHRLVDMFIAVDEVRALIMAAAMAATEGLPHATALASAAWHKARKNGQKIAEEAIQLHGGIAMTAEYPVGDYVKRLLRKSIFMPAPC